MDGSTIAVILAGFVLILSCCGAKIIEYILGASGDDDQENSDEYADQQQDCLHGHIQFELLTSTYTAKEILRVPNHGLVLTDSSTVQTDQWICNNCDIAKEEDPLFVERRTIEDYHPMTHDQHRCIHFFKNLNDENAPEITTKMTQEEILMFNQDWNRFWESGLNK